MESLFIKCNRLLELTNTEIVRDFINKINWDAQMIAIRGSRGVGKTTLMLQYIKTHYPKYSQDVLYTSLDSMYFSSHSLLELADEFYKNGGKHLFLDEVHKYQNWSRELKEIYDFYPNLRVVVSASSLLNLFNADADLSRRCVSYTMKGLSFREFLYFYHNLKFERTALDDLLKNPQDICAEVNEKCRPLMYFKEYLQYGYFPFYQKNRIDYYTLIEQIVNFVIDVELTQLCGVEVAKTARLKTLLNILSSSVPFELDISKLSTSVQIHRNTMIEYLNYLDRANLLNLVYADSLSIKKMQKPEKIYLENTNFLYAIVGQNVNAGTLRETFVVNQLKESHVVDYGKKNGDFFVDGKYTFEVGGKGKNFTQIANIDNSYILADDIETPIGKKYPIWLLGFLY